MVLNLQGHWVARREFLHGGRTYKAGEEFPLSNTSKRNARMLVEQRFIVPKDEGPRYVALNPVERDALMPRELMELERKFPDDKYASTTEELQYKEPLPPRSAELRPTDRDPPKDEVVPGMYKVIGGAGGWYDVVDPHGDVITEYRLRKEEAEQLAEEKNAGRS